VLKSLHSRLEKTNRLRKMQRILNVLTVLNTAFVISAIATAGVVVHNRESLQKHAQTIVTTQLKELISGALSESLPVPELPGNIEVPQGLPSLPL